MWDVAIIGGGPGGYTAAIRTAQLGGEVVLVEKDELGGVCATRGCIPTKTLLKSALLLDRIKNAEQFGIQTTHSVDFKSMVNRKDAVVKRVVKGTEYLMRKNGVEVTRGEGKIAGANEVEVDGRTLKARSIIIATGSSPVVLPIPGGDSAMTSDEALRLNAIPESIAIIGGGAIGCEFACLYSMLGAEVTVVERMTQILPSFDAELAIRLERIFRGRGIGVVTNAKVAGIKGGRVMVGDETIEAEAVLASVGRIANTADLGLEDAGIALDRSNIRVDARMETSVSGVYAVGDVIGGNLLAQVASAEGAVAAENAMGGHSVMDYRVVPICVFTDPEIAQVGITEQAAARNGVKTGRFPFIANGMALATGEKEGFVKVFSSTRGNILGVQIIGPHATELIHEGALAIQLNATIDELSELIHAHPTFSEALKEASLDVWGKAINK